MTGRGAGTGDRRAPMWAVASLAWITSLSTGAAINGIFFVTRNVYDFDAGRNFALALLQGAVYVVAALAVGAWVGRIRRLSDRISTRGLLAGLLGATAVVCVAAWAVRAEAMIWAFIVINSVLTGAIWPTIESYVCGGRRGADLRRATGVFNVSWASATAVALWAMQPLMLHDPLATLLGLGVMHALSIGLVPFLTREPSAHGDAAHLHTAAEAALYRRLLAGARRLLILSYLLSNVLSPMLPTLTIAAGFPRRWELVGVSLWMITRITAFMCMRSLGGWHGRPGALAASAAVLVAGFALCLLPGSAAALLVGLLVFGAGLGMVYANAIYYALEVGSTDLDAGGRHEAMIGLGYAGGPAVGLVGLWIAGPRASDGGINGAVLGVAAVATFILLIAAWRATCGREAGRARGSG